jgi:hypothetical protein
VHKKHINAKGVEEEKHTSVCSKIYESKRVKIKTLQNRMIWYKNGKENTNLPNISP